METKLNILFVEDLPTDVELAKRNLTKEGIKFESRVVDNETDFVRELEKFIPDIIISDYKMPVFDGMRALKLALEKYPNTPFILLTGSVNEDVAVECMKAGATDYIIKEHITRLPLAVKDALEKKKTFLEKEKITKELKDSEEKFRSYTEESPNMIFINKAGHIAYVNKQCEEVMGYTREEFLNPKFNFLDLISPEYVETVKENFTNRFKGVINKSHEYALLTKDKRRIEVSIAIQIINYEGESALLGNVTDITERKLAEEKLRNSFAWNEAIFEGSRDAVFVSDSDSHFVMVNQATCNLTGYSKKELLQMKIPNLHESKDLQAYLLFHDRIMNGEETLTEAKILRKDGNKIDTEFNNKRIIIDGIYYMHTSARDITERKRAENALRESEEKYQKLVELSPDAVLIHIDGRIQFANNAAVKLFDAVSKDDLLGKKVIDFIHHDYKKIVKQRINKIVDEEINVPMIEEKLVSLKGKIFDAEVTAVPINIIGQNGVQVIARDITERKRTEDELLKSKLRFEQVSEGAREWIWEVDKNGIYTYVSPIIKELLGYEAEEIIGIKYFYDFFDPEIKEELKKGALEAFASKESFRDFINCNIHKDGRKIILSTTGFPILDKKNNLIGYRGADVDITDRMRAEEALQESEERFRHSFDYAATGMCLIGTNKKFQKINNAFKEMIGYNEEEMKNFTFSDITHPDDLSIGLSQFKKMVDGENDSASFEKRYVRKDGKIIWVYVSTSLIRGINHEPKFFITQIIDITERKHAEEEITMLAHSLRSINECVSITDLKDNIVFINDSFLKTYGYNEDELIGRNVSMLRSSNNSSELVKKILPNTISGGWQGELWNKRKDGSEFPIYLSTTIINDKEGKPLGLIGVATDITERKRAEQELIEAKELAQQSDKLKSEFLAQMSHEIRTPLNAIVGNADYLSESFGKEIDSETRDSLDGINMASKRIIRTVDLILNVAELQTSGYKPQFGKVDLKSEVLGKLYREYQLTAKQKGLEFIYTCKEKDANVFADEYSITQIFANLIDNAIKYTKKGKVEILLGKNKTGNMVVEVKDTGVGISKEFLPKLFDPFVQEEQGYSRSFEGNGLGLALVKNYCHINNAIIEVESVKNVGSTFRVIFNKG